MAIVIQCTECKRKYQADERTAGKRVRCKHCGALFDVPPLRLATGPVLEDDLASVLGTMEPPPPTGERPLPGPAIVKTGPVSSKLNAVSSSMQRTGDPGDIALNGDAPRADFRRPNWSLRYPGSKEVDTWLPVLLFLGGWGWLVAETWRGNETEQTWIAVLRVSVLFLLFMAVIFPLGFVAISSAAKRCRYSFPDKPAWRVMAVLTIPFVLSCILWLVAGDLFSLAAGAILGMAVAGLGFWLLLRLNGQEAVTTGLFAAASFVGGGLLAALLLWAANMAVFQLMMSSQAAQDYSGSPVGKHLAWNIPPKPEKIEKPTKPKPGPTSPVTSAPVFVEKPKPVTPNVIEDPQPQPNPDNTSVAPPDNSVAVVPPAPDPLVGPLVVPEIPETPQPPNPTPNNVLPRNPGTKMNPKTFPSRTNPGFSPRSTFPRGTTVQPEPLPPQPRLNRTGPRVPESDSPVVASVEMLDLGPLGEILYPLVGADAVAVIHRGAEEDEVVSWSLQPLKPRAPARFRHEPGLREKYVLSPNGELLVRLAKWPELAAQIWSFEDKQLKSQPLKPGTQRPELIGFTTPTTLLIKYQDRADMGIGICNIKTHLTKSFLAPASGAGGLCPPESIAFSGDGRFMALAYRDGGRALVQIFDVEQAKPLRWFVIPGVDATKSVEPAGFAFSPDGTRLAMALEEFGQGLVLVWNLKSPVDRTQLIAKNIYPAGYGYAAPGDHSTPAHGLLFVRDDVLMLHGQGFFDLETGRLMAEIRGPEVMDQFLIGRQTVHLVLPPAPDGKQVAVVQLDLDKLTQAREALKKAE